MVPRRSPVTEYGGTDADTCGGALGAPLGLVGGGRGADPPKEGEVLVQLASSGLCHSDEHLVTGDMAFDPEMGRALGIEQFPLIGGHEGAGEVVEVGPGVSSLKVGDHVVLGFIPSCGRCPSCALGQQQLCDLGALLLSGKQLTDFTSRHHAKDGRELGIMAALGTFCPFAVVSVDSCNKIDADIPLDKASLVGCGVTTGRTPLPQSATMISIHRRIGRRRPPAAPATVSGTGGCPSGAMWATGARELGKLPLPFSHMACFRPDGTVGQRRPGDPHS